MVIFHSYVSLPEGRYYESTSERSPWTDDISQATTPARPRGRPRKDRGEEATTPARKARLGMGG